METQIEPRLRASARALAAAIALTAMSAGGSRH
jgi:hypothetical protein